MRIDTVENKRQKITEAFANPNHASAAVGTIRADVILGNERVVGHPMATLTENGKQKDEKDRGNRKI